MKYYTIRTKFGSIYEITEQTRDSLNKELLKKREARPQFIELVELGITINVDSIAVIEPDGINGKKEACEV